MTTLPLHIAKKLVQLIDSGAALPASELKHAIAEKMLEDGVLHRQLQGKQRSRIVVANADHLHSYLYNHFGIQNLVEYIQALEKPELSRSESVQVAANSKLRRHPVFKGFLVRVLEPVSCSLNGDSFKLQPTAGVCTFVTDYESFIPPVNSTIVGVENSENFIYLKEQAYLFREMAPVIFVSRYPQSHHIVQWLAKLENNYVHFGDFDFAGIQIYLNEYKKHLGDRARFFIPLSTETLLQSKGNKQLYKQQFHQRPQKESLAETELRQLLDWLDKYKKGLEQEVFIKR